MVYVLLILLLIILDWWRAGDVRRFEVERLHDTKLSLGTDNVIQLAIRNRADLSAELTLRDEPPDQWVKGATILTATIPPQESWQGSYTVHPLRRGDYQFGNITLRWRTPLGLFIRQKKLKQSADVKVYPNLLDVRKYDLLLRRNRLQAIGLRQTRLVGQGSEYERLRDYQPDDDFRRIHWKATARRHKPITVEYQTERSQMIMVLIDIGRMMQSPVANMAKLDYVVNASLLLTYVAVGMGDKVGMLTFSDEIGQYLAPKQGRGQFYTMLELLYGVEAQPIEPNYQRTFAYLRAKQRKRALTVIFTDLLGGVSMDSLIANVSLLSRTSLPLVVTINDPDIVAASQMRPTNSEMVYEQAAAAKLLDERRLALDVMAQRGVLTLDVPANQLSVAVIQRYLDIKRQTLL